MTKIARFGPFNRILKTGRLKDQAVIETAQMA
jgi:hypothetical protein